METLANLPIVLFESAQLWREWLNENHGQEQGLWLKHAKKGSGKLSVSYMEAVEEALCYGWIDGQKQSYDNEYFLQKFTPRRPKSIWSKVNVGKVAVLMAAGKMHLAGLAAVEAAKQNGEWVRAYDAPSSSAVPEDFLKALDKNPKAKQFFSTLNKTNIYAICWRIQTAKKPETRQARIQKHIEMLSNGEKLH